MSKAPAMKPLNFSFLVSQWTPQAVARAFTKVLDANSGAGQVEFHLFDNYRGRLEAALDKIALNETWALSYDPATGAGTFQPYNRTASLRFHFDFQPYPADRMRRWKKTLAAPIPEELKELSGRANREAAA